MISRTHGQPASPPKLGKEVKVFITRINEQLKLLKDIPIAAKFGGASGTRWFNQSSGGGTTSNVVQSMTHSSGTQYTYNQSNLYFQYQTFLFSTVYI